MRSLSWVVVAAALLIAACGDNYKLTVDGGNGGPPCSDGIDNDGDGQVDYPDDLGCDDPSDESEDSPAKPQCNDHRDNDGDGKTDFPSDPGCPLPQGDTEADDCPDGANCPECGDARDNDADGKIDFPNDPDCTSAGDDIEFVNGPDACGAHTMIRPLPPSGTDMATFDVSMSQSELITPCGGGGGSPAYAYVLILNEPKILVASTNYPETTADTVLDLRSVMCADPMAEIACHDDVSTTNTKSVLQASLMPGVYYLIAQGHDTTISGAYKLTVQLFAGEGASCTMQSDCGPGLVCRVPAGGMNMICTKPVCDDGLDDDGDGKIDFPADPGCVGPTDATENDDCPSGPNCPDCADGVDNDMDGQTDYPMDTSCGAASSSSEACQGEQDPIFPVITGLTTGTLVGAHDDHNPSCGSDGGVDKLFILDVPKMNSLRIDTELSAFDTLLSLLPATCSEPSIECDDDDGTSSGASLIQRTNLAAGTYVVAVDAYSGTTTPGNFNLNVSGVIAPGGSCEGQLFQAGAFTCATGFVCDGAVGAKTCRTQCSDGVDNNSDGKIDYPQDPGCSSPADNTETTVCPGAMCPACSDGVDNDLDGKTDYPMDTSCVAASGTSESCQQAEPITVVTAGMTMGTTVGAMNDVNPSCASTAGSGPDVALQLDVPLMQTLNLNLTTGYDSVHALFDSTCGGTPLSCQDPTTMQLTNVAPGRYFLVVDGWSAASSGSFTLNTSGVIAPTGSCESPLFTSGAFTCATGTACGGPVGMRTCRTECSDGLDNNADGKIDFPQDPGCTSQLDNTENTVCPGAGCPACSNTMDDDTDMLTDWPADFGCLSAAGTTEVFCAVEPNYAGAITMPTHMGTLAAPVADNYEQSCQGNTGNDVAYSLVTPVAATWRFDTEGSTIGDSVLSVKDANCGAQFGCDDDSGSGNLSLITVFLPPGNYAVQVDSYTQTSNNGPYKLNVHGVAVLNAACTSPLFASGVLSCATGQTCTAGVCQ